MFKIKVREQDATEWELSTVPNGVSYSIVDQNKNEGRTMDDTKHLSKTSQKIALSLTFNKDLTLEFMHDLLHAFSHQYIDIYFFDIWENTEMIRHFTVSNRDAVIAAWNANYKRFAPITINLEER